MTLMVGGTPFLELVLLKIELYRFSIEQTKQNGTDGYRIIIMQMKKKSFPTKTKIR